MRTQLESGFLQARRGTLTTTPMQCLGLTPNLQNCGEIYLLLKSPHLWCFVMAARAD